MPLELNLCDDMLLLLQKIETKEEHDSYMAAIWENFENRPLDTSWEIKKGPSFEAYREQGWKDREDAGMSTSHTFTVVDTDTSKIVGGANWCIYTEDPFEQEVNTLRKHPHLWDMLSKRKIDSSDEWEDGSDIRNMANQYRWLWMVACLKLMNRPQILGSTYFVSPGYEERAGALLLKQGCELADENDLECFARADDKEMPQFEAAGFVLIGDWFVDPQTDNPTKAWTELKEKIFPTPYHVFVMWRPKKSNAMKGQTQFERVNQPSCFQ